MNLPIKNARYLLLFFTLFATSFANAVMIEFSPQDQTVMLGDQATVDVVVSDLAGEFVGTYDFFVNYDSSILGLADFIFGDSLGGAADSIQITDFSDGSINAAEVSLLFDLLSVQDGTSSFVLFSIVFDTLTTGISDLLFEENILGFAGGFLGDELGAPLLASTQAGSIEVIDNPVSIPEPGTMLLLLIGFVLMQSVRAKRS